MASFIVYIFIGGYGTSSVIQHTKIMESSDYSESMLSKSCMFVLKSVVDGDEQGHESRGKKMSYWELP